MISLYVALAWLTGILAGIYLQPPITISATAALAGAIGTLGFWPQRNLRAASLFVLSLSLATLRTGLAAPPPAPVIDYDGKCTITGAVVEDPVPKPRSLQLKVQASALQYGSSQRQLDMLVLVWTRPYEDFRSGDRLSLTGYLQAPSTDLGPGYIQFLANQGIFYTMTFPEVERLAAGQESNPLQLIDRLRDEVSARLEQVMPAPESALLTGILLGDRSGMPQSLQDDFAATSTTHIIAISGQNITMIAGVVILLAGLLRRRRLSLILVIAIISLYTVFVGAGASVVRAAIMGILWAVARHFGREASAIVSIAITACLMTLYQPSIILDVGFQLSFVSTLGLIFFSQPLMNKLRRVPPVLREAVTTTLAAQLAVLPIQLYVFQQLSLVSVPANLLAVPALPVIMLTGGFAALSSLVWQPLGMVASWPAWLFLYYMIRVVEVFAALPFAAIAVPAIPLVFAFLWYLVLGMILLIPRLRPALAGSGGHPVLRAALGHGFTIPFLASTAVLIWLLVAARVIFGW